MGDGDRLLYGEWRGVVGVGVVGVGVVGGVRVVGNGVNGVVVCPSDFFMFLGLCTTSIATSLFGPASSFSIAIFSSGSCASFLFREEEAASAAAPLFLSSFSESDEFRTFMIMSSLLITGDPCDRSSPLCVFSSSLSVLLYVLSEHDRAAMV